MANSHLDCRLRIRALVDAINVKQDTTDPTQKGHLFVKMSDQPDTIKNWGYLRVWAYGHSELSEYHRDDVFLCLAVLDARWTELNAPPQTVREMTIDQLKSTTVSFEALAKQMHRTAQDFTRLAVLLEQMKKDNPE